MAREAGRSHRRWWIGVRLGVLTNAAFYATMVLTLPLALADKGFEKSTIAFFFAIGSATAGVLNLSVGPLLRKRGIPWWSLALAIACGIVGLLGVGWATDPLAALIFSPLLAAMTLIFPLLVATASTASSQNDSRLASSMRSTFVIGYVIGLCLAALAQSAPELGVPVDGLALAVVLAFCNLAASWLIRSPRRSATTEPAAPAAESVSRRVALTATIAVLALVAADTLRLVYLPLYVVHRGLSPEWVSILLLAAVVAELPILPVLGRLTERLGSPTTLAVVCAVGVMSFGMLAIGGGVVFLLVSQAIYGAFAAGVQSVGVVHLGSVLRGGLGAGAGLFTTLLQVGALTGLVAPLMVPGYTGSMFVIGALFCVLGAPLALTGRWASTRRAVARSQP
ncbi:MFS transporter [Phytohabitans sp. LJ34]|uniref:MFS transporter n=1 Tax=Phytohabitans sp. LJ34 TaxID=3452217 RepID=UPI003F8BE6F4